MSAFTRLGAAIWDWEPWTELAAIPRVLWLALYTSAEAKRHVPGLWHGGIPSMADAARLSPDDVILALDALLERELVEYDRKFRVLRLSELPDAGEYPNNGNVLRSWWTRFRTVPVCAVRDTHVKTVAWLCDVGSRRAGKVLSPNHQEAWTETFGTIVVPPPRRRGVRRLADSDTSTQAQPSLFSLAAPSGNGFATAADSAYPQNPQPAVDNSDVLRQSNEISYPETVPGTVRGTNRIPDLGSRILDLGSSGEGEGGRGARPVLSLVPPFTVAEVLAEMRQGRWDPAFDRSHQDALSALFPGLVARGVTLGDFAVLREYSVAFTQAMSARWLAGCDIAEEIDRARKRLDWRDAQAKAVADSMP